MKVDGRYDRSGEAAVLISHSTLLDEPLVVRVYLSTKIPEKLDPMPQLIFTSNNATHSVSYTALATGGQQDRFDVCMLSGLSTLIVTAYWSTTVTLSTSLQIFNITLTDENCTPSLNSKPWCKVLILVMSDYL